jgi:hypothetical protein
VELGSPGLGRDAGITVPPEQQQTEPLDPSATGGGLPEVAPLGGLDGLGEFDSLPESAEKGCEKVDFLFVIDNSRSMAFAQENLKNSFAGFLSVLGDNLDANDFHIMVVDTDSWDGRAEDGEQPTVDAATGIDRCNDTLGAGRRSNGQDQQDCQVANGKRFVSLEQPELDSTFACMATVGTLGNAREQQMGAMLAAVSGPENDVGGCNEGFLRRDAILVVTIITNTDDQASLGDPAIWYDTLLQQTDKEEASVVVQGFLPGDAFAPSSSGLICNVLAAINSAPRLEEFISSFTHGHFASVCESDYGPFFDAAVDSIQLACDDFVPPAIQ